MMSSYKLSAEILGHSADVRVVRALSNSTIATASRDGTACIWSSVDSLQREFLLKKVIKNHTGFVSSLCVIPSPINPGGENFMLATGGQDNTILVHSLDAGVKEPLQRYVGHLGLVSCIVYFEGQIVSGSWDSTVKIWKGPNSCDTIQAHKPAVWAVACILSSDGNKRILSGGADHLVCLWEMDTKMRVQDYKGHNDVVRDIKAYSNDWFLSASNDCVIRKWNVHSGQCVHQFFGHEAFVYSIALLPSSIDGFVSSGEDGSLRVWKGEGCQEVIHVPAVSVWSVDCASNGDIIAGSSDGVTRVFTTNEDRTASSQALNIFSAKLDEHRSSAKQGSIDVRKLPGKAALLNPGKSSGETLMVNNEGVPEVYQWDADAQDWIKIGNAIGKAPDNSKVYNGQEFDYVFDIELDEGPPPHRTLKLPYNRDTDPYVAAENFLSVNNLPAHYLDQVAEFISNNTSGGYIGGSGSDVADPFTGGNRYIPSSAGSNQAINNMSSGLSVGGAADPFTGGGGYRPGDFGSRSRQEEKRGESSHFFPMSGYKIFESTGDYGDQVFDKVNEFSLTMGAEGLSEIEVTQLGKLCRSLTKSPSQLLVDDFIVVEKILNWPQQYIFPGLDILRLALCTSAGVEYFIQPDSSLEHPLIKRLFTFASGAGFEKKNLLLVLRCLANMFFDQRGVEVLNLCKVKVFDRLATIHEHCQSRPSQIALSSVVLNYAHYFSKSGKLDGCVECTKHICKILNSSFDSEAKFRVLVAAGSLALVSTDAVKVSAAPYDILVLLEQIIRTADIPKVKQCAEIVQKALTN